MRKLYSYFFQILFVMKWKTAIVFSVSLFFAAVLVIFVGYVFDYKPYVSVGPGTTYFDAVATFGYLPLWAGSVLLIFVVARGKCEWCGDLRGKTRLQCDLCGYKACSPNCFYKHVDHKKCVI